MNSQLFSQLVIDTMLNIGAKIIRLMLNVKSPTCVFNFSTTSRIEYLDIEYLEVQFLGQTPIIWLSSTKIR